MESRTLEQLLDVETAITDYATYSMSFFKEIASKKLASGDTSELVLDDSIDYLLDDLDRVLHIDYTVLEQIEETAYKLGYDEAGIEDLASLSYNQKDNYTGTQRSAFVYHYLRGRAAGMEVNETVDGDSTAFGKTMAVGYFLLGSILAIAATILALWASAR